MRARQRAPGPHPPHPPTALCAPTATDRAPSLVTQNLRPLVEGCRRRLQILFDAHGWTETSGMTRWLLRSPDTIVNHNNPRYARDQITMVQQDKNKWLLAATKMGGEDSMYARIKAGVKTKCVPMKPIIEEKLAHEEFLQIQSLHPDALESTKELLSMKVENFLDVQNLPIVSLYLDSDSLLVLPPRIIPSRRHELHYRTCEILSKLRSRTGEASGRRPSRTLPALLGRRPRVVPRMVGPG